MKSVLNGHVSPETAYLVDSYPYGFKLRCKIRYWIETKKGFGMRFVSQTTNPKASGFSTTPDVWNKPKAGVYSSIVVMVQYSDTGYITSDGLHISASADSIIAFKEAYGSQLSKEDAYYLECLEKISRRQNPVSWSKVTV